MNESLVSGNRSGLVCWVGIHQGGRIELTVAGLEVRGIDHIMWEIQPPEANDGASTDSGVRSDYTKKGATMSSGTAIRRDTTWWGDAI